MKRAVIYVRVSSREQAESGYSLDAQVEACRRFVEGNGWTLVGEYVDAGESAKTADRPNFQKMLRQLQDDRSIGFVVVHKIDRFARNLEDHVNVRARFKKWGVRLVSASEGFEDTPTGRMLEGIVASISGWYSENLGQEVKKGMYQKARSGIWPTVAPIGYLNQRTDSGRKAESVLVVDPETAPLIREAFDLYATGDWSLRRLHAEMTKRGLRTRKGVPFSVSKLAETLQHNVYYGMVRWGGEEHPGIHTPLVSKETFDKVQEAFRSHDRSAPRLRKHPHYLRGSLICAGCGAKLSSMLAKGRFPYFFCIGRALEEACADERRMRFDSIDDYIAGDWPVLKPHGSWTWVQEVKDERYPPGTGNSYPTASRHDLIDNFSDLVLAERIVVHRAHMSSPDADSIELMDEARTRVPVVPALTIPVMDKSRFVFPNSHLKCLREACRDTAFLMTIGWHGQEHHFLNELAGAVSSTSMKVLIVTASEPGAQVVQDTIQQHGIRADFAQHTGGFGSFLRDPDRLEGLLNPEAVR